MTGTKWDKTLTTTGYLIDLAWDQQEMTVLHTTQSSFTYLGEEIRGESYKASFI